MLAHWIKNAVEEAGIDTTIFKAHSVQGASSTAAAEKGVLIADILKTLPLSDFIIAPLQAVAMLRQCYSRKREGEGKMPLQDLVDIHLCIYLYAYIIHGWTLCHFVMVAFVSHSPLRRQQQYAGLFLIKLC